MRRLALILLAIASFGFTGTLHAKTFEMTGSAMQPVLRHADRLSAAAYAPAGPPQRGDIAVFVSPVDPKGALWIKRVIGLPGEEVTIKGGLVYVRNVGSLKVVKLNEPYLGKNAAGRTYRHPVASADTSTVTFRVPDNHYFVLGDNRTASFDSRSMVIRNNPAPFVPLANMQWRINRITLPATRTKTIPRLSY